MTKTLFSSLLLAVGMTALASEKTPLVLYQVEVRAIDTQERETVMQSMAVVVLDGQTAPVEYSNRISYPIACNPKASPEVCARMKDVQSTWFNMQMTPEIRVGAIQTQFRISVHAPYPMDDMSVAGQNYRVVAGTSMSMETDIPIPTGEKVVINMEGFPTMKKYRFIVQAKAI